jgi:hypothetical protein
MTNKSDRAGNSNQTLKITNLIFKIRDFEYQVRLFDPLVAFRIQCVDNKRMR